MRLTVLALFSRILRNDVAAEFWHIKDDRSFWIVRGAETAVNTTLKPLKNSKVEGGTPSRRPEIQKLESTFRRVASKLDFSVAAL